jgi:hypothetical protein
LNVTNYTDIQIIAALKKMPWVEKYDFLMTSGNQNPFAGD